MAQEFKVSCPKCKTVFFVPLEYGGEEAECAQCEFVFRIPNPEVEEDYHMTETGTISGVEIDKLLNRSTVKLSRSSIGMIPNVKDRFEFGAKVPPLATKNDDF